MAPSLEFAAIGPRVLAAFLVASLPALCSPMSAWYANNGVQFVMQDTDDYLYYSYCNTSFDLVFPTDQSLKLPVSAKPRPNTAITGVGWYDDQGETTWACVWYFDSFDDLIYKRFRCDPDKGEFETEDEQILTDEIPSEVQLNKESGLAAVLLGATDGIRLYVHDADDAIHSLMFTNDRGWGYERLINPDQSITGKAIGAVNRITKGNEITLITPKDSLNIEECSLDRDGHWYINSFPYNLSAYNVTNLSPEQEYFVSTFEGPLNGTELEAWDGRPGNIGVALGEDYRSMYYIGTDKAIHKLSSYPTINNTVESKDDYINKGQWQVDTSQEEKYWPLADEANANFAMAGWLDDKGAHLHLYYISNGSLTLALFENSTWAEAATVPTVLPPPEIKNGSGRKGLSDGAKAGIGVGAFIGGFAICFAFGAIMFMRRRRQQNQQDREAAAAQYQGQVPPYQPEMYPTYSPYDQHGQFAIQGQQFAYMPAASPDSMDPKPEEAFHPSELPERHMSSYEMLGEGHFREMPTPTNPEDTGVQFHASRYGEPSPNSEVGDIPIRRG